MVRHFHNILDSSAENNVEFLNLICTIKANPNFVSLLRIAERSVQRHNPTV